VAPPRLLTFSTLYPNSADPLHGVFVEARLRHLIDSGLARSSVIAPVPWFPSRAGIFGRYARIAAAPGVETRYGIEVRHPRYPVVPKIGMNAASWGLYAASRPVVRDMLDRDGFDVINTHYFYPDGVAAAMLARHFKKPLAITAHGSDIDLLSRFAVPRRLIRWAAGQADVVIAVCQALRNKIIGLGVEGSKIEVLRNGVDLERFRPVDQMAARRSLDLPQQVPIILTVGRLVELKGHHLVIKALAEMPDTHLMIAGEGPLAEPLRELASALDLTGRIRFLGAIAQERLACVYSAADALIVASSREGWASVLLEAMACGTPVIATKVGGNPEVVTTPLVGRLIEVRTPGSIAAGVKDLLGSRTERGRIRAFAERFSWDDTSEGQARIFNRLCAERGS